MAGPTLRDFGIPQGAIAAWFSARYFGAPTRPNVSTPTATTSVATLVKNNPNRLELAVINLGANNVYVAPISSTPVSSTAGILLVPQGGQVIVKVVDDGELVSMEWDVISSGGSSALFVLELLADSSPQAVF